MSFRKGVVRVIEEAKKLAEKYLDEKTYQHSERVARYTMENRMIPEHLRERCIALAWIHDVWEDSDCGTEEILALDETRRLVKYMNYITHGKNEKSYEDYIISIKNAQTIYPEVWWVKLADMKDHLSQRDTLTDRLKNKYANALAILL